MQSRTPCYDGSAGWRKTILIRVLVASGILAGLAAAVLVIAGPAQLRAAPVQSGSAALALPVVTVAPGALITVAVTLAPAGAAI